VLLSRVAFLLSCRCLIDGCHLAGVVNVIVLQLSLMLSSCHRLAHVVIFSPLLSLLSLHCCCRRYCTVVVLVVTLLNVFFFLLLKQANRGFARSRGFAAGAVLFDLGRNGAFWQKKGVTLRGLRISNKKRNPPQADST
jgi:hypothetical protein